MITQNVWRFQCDPKSDDIDPLVQVFTKDVTVVDGETFEKVNMEPFSVPLSEVSAAYAAKAVDGLAAKRPPKKPIIQSEMEHLPKSGPEEDIVHH